MNVFTPTIAIDVEAQKRVRKWIRALRSGAYEQGRAKLRGPLLVALPGRTTTRGNEDRFCCLGVACDVVAPEGWAVYEANTPYPMAPDWGHDLAALTDYGPMSEHGPMSELSRQGLRVFRLSEAGQKALILLNDGGTPFKAIAARLSRDLRDRMATGGPVIDSRP